MLCVASLSEGRVEGGGNYGGGRYVRGRELWRRAAFGETREDEEYESLKRRVTEKYI